MDFLLGATEYEKEGLLLHADDDAKDRLEKAVKNSKAAGYDISDLIAEDVD
ncbi:Uu.00g139330.m01.CDS01 [Anthostomella pinea]|uniref:Uu.00g139330.m01.CDS01 n=1 Tax=Anthostomella pinea TaxID=933095 RepID=A0AAI8VR27_9PEZI|nr:Uu.00g139330.m01.CDS01 [Anthostomella pinea]